MEERRSTIVLVFSFCCLTLAAAFSPIERDSRLEYSGEIVKEQQDEAVSVFSFDDSENKLGFSSISQYSSPPRPPVASLPKAPRSFADWMGDNFDVLSNLTLTDVLLPGTHDSGKLPSSSFRFVAVFVLLFVFWFFVLFFFLSFFFLLSSLFLFSLLRLFFSGAQLLWLSLLLYRLMMMFFTVVY